MGKHGISLSPFATTKGPTSPDDFAIISDLLETVEQNPNSIEAKKVLAQQYQTFGWNEAAEDIIRQILALQPGEKEASEWLVAWVRGESLDKTTEKKKTASCLPKIVRPALSKRSINLDALESGYRLLMAESQGLFEELAALQELAGDRPVLAGLAGHIADLKAISEGRITSTVKIRPPPAARVIAAKITAGPSADIAFEDLDMSARWMRSQEGSEDADKVRDTVRKRAEAIKTTLPAKLTHVVDTAFMHIEHEVLGKVYQNEDNMTMLGDAISSIPRADFWVSEDGYAWDMSELAEAIKANKGVMRNPLSKQMFSADDVKSIVRHKHGQSLAAMQLRQEQLSQGVRMQTVERLENMATILLADQSMEASPSREAVEDYITYVATLPEAEQTALDELRVPATDSHTGRAFDVTIGEAVADAKANRQCFHKTGDHLRQAAKFLRAQAPVAAQNVRVPGAWE